MMRSVILTLFPIFLVASMMGGASVASVAPISPPAFTRKPTIVRAADRVTIRFAVNKETDVEVAIMNAAGDVVRHLAAGRLDRTPPPPLKPGLEQVIEWDGKDDDGKAVVGAARARVRLGLGAALDRFVPSSLPAIQTSVTALGVGKGGELYVLSNRGHAGAYLYALDRQGRYLRTIIPTPANLKNDDIKGLERLTLKDGAVVPVVFQANAAHLAPHLSGIRQQQLTVTKDGWIIFASGGNDYSDQLVPRHVLVVKADGTTPAEVGFVGPRLGPHGRYSLGLRPQQLAASPDGKTLYFAGLGSDAFGRHPARGLHAIGRLSWNDNEPTPFIGKPDEPGDDATRLNSPTSVATDARGNIYVVDAGNNRIAAFAPDGKPLGQTKVDAPRQVCVNPKTGEMFVVTSQPGPQWGPFALIKFDKAVGGTEVARLALTGRNAIIALDAAATPPRLWLAYSPAWGKEVLMPVEDGGRKLEPGANLLAPGAEHTIPLFLAVDPARERLYVGDLNRTIRTIDLKTDKMSGRFLTASEVALDRHGNLYVLSGHGTHIVLRLTPDGKPLPFEATGSEKLSVRYRAGLPHIGVRGLTVAPNGDLYIFQDNNLERMRLQIFGPDGRMKNEQIIRDIPADSANSVAVDRSGNIYVGINVHDPKRLYPPAFEGIVPDFAWMMIYPRTAGWYGRFPQRDKPQSPPWSRLFMNFYLHHYGSVFKFPPTGGRFYASEGVPKAGENPRPAEVPATAVEYRTGYLNQVVWCEGALWRYPGFSLVNNRTENIGKPTCSCWTGRFAIDDFSRLFVPDVFRFSVGVVDSSGSEITRFGGYGNVDSAGPGSAIPKPEIPFAWANAVAAGGGKVYVGDRVNRRIAVIRLTYATEETLNIR